MKLIMDNIPYEAVKEYYDDYEFPCQVTYEAGPLLGDFDMIITNEQGEELTFDENTDWSEYYLNCTDEELKEIYKEVCA